MTYPTALLIHSCQVETGETLGAADAYGVSSTTKTYATVSCRFIQLKNTMSRGEVGDQATRNTSVIVPTGTAITEGKTVVGLSTGYTKTWRVKAVRPAIIRASISHITADLEVVG